MRKWTLLLAAGLATLWLQGGVALATEGAGRSETKNAGTYQVELTTAAEGLKVGEGELAVHLRDRSTGQPVVRDSVRVEILMDEADTSMKHGNMSLQVPAPVELRADKSVPGRYVGRAGFPEAGDWYVRVFADTRAGQAPVAFKVNVAAGGPNWLVLGAIVAVLALAVGGVAALVRRKSAATPVADAAWETSEA